MHQISLPQEYVDLSPEVIATRIQAAKDLLGPRLVILGHHYQRDEIIAFADYRGDSFKLAKDAALVPDAEFIVFCGVHFMAESADILTADNQKVILPNLAAGCSMADMANLFQVRNCWKQLAETVGTEGIVPVNFDTTAPTAGHLALQSTITAGLAGDSATATLGETIGTVLQAGGASLPSYVLLRKM